MRTLPLILLAGTAATLTAPAAACSPPTPSCAIAAREGHTALAHIAEQAQPGRYAAIILDANSGALLAARDADRPMPLQSVFKAPLAAAVLAQVDVGTLALDRTITLARGDLSAPYSPINDAWPRRSAYTVAELIEAAAGGSDNTAADVLMHLIGGPRAVTTYLRAHGIAGIRIDRYEREFQPQSVGLGAMQPAWTNEAAFTAAAKALPPGTRAAAVRAYLADPRDTASPRAAAQFLRKLARGELLSPSSTRLLLEIMTRTPSGAHRLKAALPVGATVAHKTGTGRTVDGVNLATNDIALITLPNGRQRIVASFLAGATTPEDARDAPHAATGRLAAQLTPTASICH